MVKKEPELSSSFEERGPGAHLRRAREAANMSVDKVATALLLNAQIVEAIEADSFEHLPAPTFVRGYLRGYARVLGLPAGPVLEMYDRCGFEPPPLAPDVVESHQAHTSDVPVRLVTYAVAAVLAVLVGLWWNSQEDGGFAIGADLFDWSSDPAEDMSPGDVAEAGTAPADTGAEDESNRHDAASGERGIPGRRSSGTAARRERGARRCRRGPNRTGRPRCRSRAHRRSRTCCRNEFRRYRS